MGVDYNGVGGIGVRLSPEMVKTAIEKNMFTEEDWEEDPIASVEVFQILYAQAGSAYSGKEWFYLFVDGNNLEEINNNSKDFLDKVNKMFDLKYTEKDLKVISDLYIW
ncbi:hypothetical protein [Aeromonas phage 4L372D]|uniref:Uncharacterized protein n=3 Tax=Plateaulakevirus TaxID=2843436 RepID=A0A5B9N431_9CAUD|nr:hypothetical protein HWC25_gp182 [Aeromonas phage 2L372D]YP_009846520.1 hypothetical protein HWC26_gp183 [Aeromonas phage 2L372X]YP_009846748.1 hypothetical protein HWC27_gp191 [Aeromonas phage 4L372D]QDB74096.1 hypothetical protein 2L372D_182 [Aeromonas phage 2L372D]QEG08435.1 hypothetical protein [Aeromonas phage 2L372X]QEG08664.1 hypothetical protein [Aeromonas phage 4L372D]